MAGSEVVYGFWGSISWAAIWFVAGIGLGILIKSVRDKLR